MYRNPKDVAVSYFHFAGVLSYVQYSGPFERFAKLFIRDKGKVRPTPSLGSGNEKQVWQFLIDVQGDHSACAKPPVDIKTKVPLWHSQARAGQARPKRNFVFEVNRFCTS